MSKIMLVNVTHVEESRVAIVEDGVLAAYEIETTNRTNIKGNIYNVVVESVQATLEASFVRLAADLKGFLPLDEVNFKLLPSRSESRKSGKIGQHLHSGQKIMAQVVREPFGGKPPTVSTYFSLPGRYLVLMPGVDSSGISRKIEHGDQRDRLKKILGELQIPEGFGLIVRTAGVGQNKTELQRDLRYLLRLWESIQRASRAAEFPGLVYREADLVIRTMRDFLTRDIGEVWIDSKETYEKALAFVRDVMPKRAGILKLYTGERPLFNKFNLEEQIERIYKRRVPLPAGGEIVIDGTEALTAIDVNSARSKRQGDIDENNTQTNLEAAAEIARQLRLRDLGGLIVVDFIDMASTRNKKKVERAMREAMRGDPARYDVTTISKLGLMELARQRMKGAKMAASYATCSHCDGYGLIKNVETAALAALRKLQTRIARGGIGRIRVGLPPEVANWLLNNKREELLRMERRHDVQTEIVPKASLLRHESEFETLAREREEAPPEPAATAEVALPAASESRPARGEPATAAADRPAAAAEPAVEAPGASADPGAGTAGEARGRRRRRRRRRPRGGGAESGGAEGGGAESGGAESRGAESRGAESRGAESRGAAGGKEDQPATEAADEEAVPLRVVGRAGTGETVPRGVRADELMPAASGSRARKGGTGKRRTQGSRRRRRNSRGGSRASG